jgi:DNA-binding response OmpR family regulator
MSPLRKIVVLIIEDSTTVRHLYRMTFEKEGFEVLEAANGRDGWIFAYQKMPDIIVLDMILPDFHGLEVLKKIRSNSTTKNIPVLALTSLKEIKDVQQAINLGANYYSVKGTDSPQKIVNMIYKLLKRNVQETLKNKPTESENEIISKPAKNENPISPKPNLQEPMEADDIEFITSQ